jgi:hypothetical protein
MRRTKWKCERCGATGEVSHQDGENCFEVAGKVIANHNETATDCQVRPDSMVNMGGDVASIAKEPKSSWVV